MWELQWCNCCSCAVREAAHRASQLQQQQPHGLLAHLVGCGCVGEFAEGGSMWCGQGAALHNKRLRADLQIMQCKTLSRRHKLRQQNYDGNTVAASSGPSAVLIQLPPSSALLLLHTGVWRVAVTTLLLPQVCYVAMASLCPAAAPAPGVLLVSCSAHLC